MVQKSSSLERLIQQAEQSPFVDVQQDMHTRIETLIADARKHSPHHDLTFSTQDMDILAFGYYHAIQQYSTASPRKLGGPYFVHPDAVFQELLHAGITDIATLLTGLDHDAIEEKVATQGRKKYVRRLRSDSILQQLYKDKRVIEGKTFPSSDDRRAGLKQIQGQIYDRERILKDAVRASYTKRKYRTSGKRSYLMPSKETRLIQQYLADFHNNFLKTVTSTLSLEPAYARQIAADLTETIRLVTREGNEKYYKSIGHVFAPKHKLINEENIVRAIITKFADRLANTDDLEVEDATAKRRDSITYNALIDAWKNDDQAMKRVIIEQTIAHARIHPQQVAGEYTGEERLYQCFKNIVLINIYRERKVRENRPINKVNFLYLAAETRQEAEIILNHLCTYHAGDDILNPEKIYHLYEECKQYEEAGGLDNITRSPVKNSTPRGFDGIFEYFFDARVRGDNKKLRELYDDRSLMFKAALAFYSIATKYIEDKSYILEGLTKNGLKSQAAIEPTMGK